MVSIMTDSRIARKPLAPVFLSCAFFATALTASSVKVSFTPSISNSFVYCFVIAFFGSVRIFTRAASSSCSSDTITGRRPINSGISPNFTKSSGSTCANNSLMLRSSFPIISAPNPIDPLPRRLSTIFSRPSNAPPQINKMLVVSICKSS